MHHADAERDRVMRRADVADAPVYQDLAAIGGVEAVGDAHRRRLAGAVLAHQGVDRPGRHRNAQVVVRQNAAEAFADAPELEHALRRHRVGDLDLAGDDLPPGLFRVPDGLGRHQIPVEVIDHVADTVALEPEHVEAAGELSLDRVLDDVVDGGVDAFDHAGEHEAGLDAVLVRIDADPVPPRAALRGPGRFGRI